MNRREEIGEILKNASGKSSTPEPDEGLFDSGYLDSFALPDLVAELEKRFRLKIPDADLTPRKFESIARIEAYLDSRG